MLDVVRLRASFGEVARHGDEVPLYFYSYLFLRRPELRALFPPSMAGQRERLLGALVTAVTEVDRADVLVPYLRDLGRDHRKYGVVPDHYHAVGEALLATLAHFLGQGWDEHTAATWTAAYEFLADTMITAAQEDEARVPPVWSATVVAHELRGVDVAVVTVRAQSPVPYRAGQSVSLQLALRPRLWRFYSPANAPRADGLIEFHVRAVDGGWVSSALVHGSAPGDALALGPAVGALGLPADPRRPLLLVAGGTGLAPLTAMIEEMIFDPAQARPTDLVVAARTPADHYDLARLRHWETTQGWLTVHPVLDANGGVESPTASAARFLSRCAPADRIAVVCGNTSFVTTATSALAAAGFAAHDVVTETFGYRSGRSDAPAAGHPLGDLTR